MSADPGCPRQAYCDSGVLSRVEGRKEKMGFYRLGSMEN